MPTTAHFAYPPTKQPRVGPGPSEPNLQGAATTPPRMRHITFDMSAGIGQRTTQSTPRLSGYAIVKSMRIIPRTVSDPPVHGVEIGYTTSPVNEPSVPFANPKGWSPLMERVTSTTGSINFNLLGNIIGTVTQENFIQGMDLNLLVPQPSPIITVTLFNLGGIAMNSWVIMLTILENANPEALLNFL